MFRYLIFILIYGLHLFSLNAQANWENKGTLIVTYQTNGQGLRLERIRFWLINEKQERTLFPKKDEFVAHNQSGRERTVVIGHLPAGRYTLQFVVPNTDNFFEAIPSKQIDLHEREVLKIEQEIKERNPKEKRNSFDITSLTAGFSFGFLKSLFNVIIINNPIIDPFEPIPTTAPFTEFTTFSLKTNFQTEWKLMRSGRIILSGRGPVSDVVIPADTYYYVIAEDIPGYTTYIDPSRAFNAESGRPVKAELYYQRDTGFAHIQGIWPDTSPFTFTITSQNRPGPPFTSQIRPINGVLSWDSGSFPTGNYVLSYKQLGTNQVISMPFMIVKGEHSILNLLHTGRTNSLEVTTNTGSATFTLKNENGDVIGTGQGQHYLFDKLQPGSYTIVFQTNEPQSFLAPPSQTVYVETGGSSNVEVFYEKLGRLSLSSNLKEFTARIESLDKQVSPIEEKVTNRGKTINLPEGQYQVRYLPLSPNESPLGPVQVKVKPFSTQTVYLAYDKKLHTQEQQVISSSSEKPQKSGIQVSSNISDSKYHVEGAALGTISKESFYQGKNAFTPLSEKGEYTLIFESVPNYETPQPVKVDFQPGQMEKVEVNYTRQDSFVEVPAGEAIVGDPFQDLETNTRPAKKVDIPFFLIGTYPVTNSQFTSWLNASFKGGNLAWHPTIPGYIINKENQLICRTMDGHPLSQIMRIYEESSEPKLIAFPGKENYPVIQVTWQGARAYCLEQGYRLPTEDEWEKAAGMGPSQDGNIGVRYKFAFGRDEIDRTWANYKDTPFSSRSAQVFTTPIGFYNGKNTLPLTPGDRQQQKTHDAKSPAGAYDMSGNVWEWVESGDEQDPNKKIVKGGCYDSLSDSVRVSSRLSLDADYADIFTGFRAAKDTK